MVFCKSTYIIVVLLDICVAARLPSDDQSICRRRREGNEDSLE